MSYFGVFFKITSMVTMQRPDFGERESNSYAAVDISRDLFSAKDQNISLLQHTTTTFA